MKALIFVALMLSSVWSMSYEDALAESQKTGKMLIVELVMEFCSFCEKMDKYVLSSADVKQVLNEHYVLIKLDINKDEIPEKFTSRLTPTFYFLNQKGDKIIQEIVGAPSKSQFLSYLNTLYQQMEK